MKTIIMHEIKTQSGKIRKFQPVDRYRNLLKKQKLNFTETISTVKNEPDFLTHGRMRHYSSDSKPSDYNFMEKEVWNTNNKKTFYTTRYELLKDRKVSIFIIN